jgi:uncharacterized protein (TIGR02145 family)
MGDGTVQDCRTGLVWLKEANCMSASGGATPDTLGRLTWYDAMKWAAGLQDTGTPGTGCGLSDGSSAGDWRLPTETEWKAMVAYANKQGYGNPSLTNAAGTGKWTTNGDAFNNVQSDVYWSSTTFGYGAAYVGSVYFVNGHVGSQGRDNLSYIWPVRDGQSVSFGNLIIR